MNNGFGRWKKDLVMLGQPNKRSGENPEVMITRHRSIHLSVYTSEERGRGRLTLDSFMHAYHIYGKVTNMQQ
jgi:hypothetical protein